MISLLRKLTKPPNRVAEPGATASGKKRKNVPKGDAKSGRLGVALTISARVFHFAASSFLLSLRLHVCYIGFCNCSTRLFRILGVLASSN